MRKINLLSYVSMICYLATKAGLHTYIPSLWVDSLNLKWKFTLELAVEGWTYPYVIHAKFAIEFNAGDVAQVIYGNKVFDDDEEQEVSVEPLITISLPSSVGPDDIPELSEVVSPLIQTVSRINLTEVYIHGKLSPRECRIEYNYFMEGEDDTFDPMVYEQIFEELKVVLNFLGLKYRDEADYA